MKLFIITGGVTKESATISMSADFLKKTAHNIDWEPVEWRIGPARQASLIELAGRLERGDVVLPLISGLEGYLTALDIPYVGSDATAAGVAANKGLFNDCLRAWGMRKVKYLRLHQAAHIDLDLLASFHFPLFVKPARLGGSNGISRVEELADLGEAVTIARTHDPEVIIEEFAGHYEVEIAAIAGEDLVLSEPGIVQIPSTANWHSSAAKQASTMDVETLRGTALSSRCKDIARTICRNLGVSSGFRLDLFVIDEEIYVGEINCVPGHNVASNFPKIFGLSGMPRERQLQLLINSAYWKHQAATLNKSSF